MRRRAFITDPVYYTYVLFDYEGIPRYVGKGKGARWLSHEKGVDPRFPIKNDFVARTLLILGEIPKIKVREGLPELEAYTTEIALIKAIGRLNKGTGPLTNLTDGGGAPGTTRGGRIAVEMKAGIHGWTEEQRRARNSKAGKRAGELGRSGFHQLTREQQVEFGRRCGARAARAKVEELGINPFKVIVTCPHCGKTGTKAILARWHFDHCKLDPDRTPSTVVQPNIVTCPHCGKTGGDNVMHRYHFDNCPHKPETPIPRLIRRAP